MTDRRDVSLLGPDPFGVCIEGRDVSVGDVHTLRQVEHCSRRRRPLGPNNLCSVERAGHREDVTVRAHHHVVTHGTHDREPPTGADLRMRAGPGAGIVEI